MRPRGWPVLVLLAAAAVAHGSAASAPASDDVATPNAQAAPRRYDDPLAAIADYRAGLDALLAAIPEARAETASPAQALERLVYPRLAWGRWQADGSLMAVTPGSRSSGVWVLVLEPDHPQLATPGPTMTTRELDIGVLAVQVRPDRMPRACSSCMK